MGFIKDIKEIKQFLNETYKELFYKARKYDELKDLLSKVTVNVKNIREGIDELANEFIEIEYSIPTVQIKFDNEGNEIMNERFKAMNLSGIIPIEDLIKMSKKITQIQNKIKGGVQ